MTTPTNDLTELRAHLFETLRAVRDKDAPMPVETARAVCAVAEQLTATARVELDYLRAIGADATHSSLFLAGAGRADEQVAHDAPRAIASGVVRVVQHRIGG